MDARPKVFLHGQRALLLGNSGCNGDDGLSDHLTVLRLDLQLRGHQREGDRLSRHLQLQEPDALDVKLDEDDAVVGLVHLLQVLGNLAQGCLFDASFDPSREFGI